MVTGLGTPKRFRTTRWSLVIRAGAGTADGRDALDALCRLYWYPLYAFVRRSEARRSPDECRDLVQEFLARVFARDDVSTVSEERGRFRSWLLQSMRNFLTNEWHRESAQKRGGGLIPLSVDLGDAEDRYQREPTDGVTPDKLFMRRWAYLAIEAALASLRGECEAAGARKLQLFEVLRPRLMGDADEMEGARVAAAVGLSPAALRQATSRLRKDFKRHLVAHVADTLDTEDAAAVDEEIRSLFAAVE
jgi:RNA polymerase sigma-70 factor (ECF subfamily)